VGDRHFTFGDASPAAVADVLEPDTIDRCQAAVTWDEALARSDPGLGQVSECDEWEERWRKLPGKEKLRAVYFLGPGPVTIRWGTQAALTRILSGPTHDRFRCRNDPIYARTGHICRTDSGIHVQG
jgi:hypothetical protein